MSDADDLGRAVAEGLEGYRSFAPPGWTPGSAVSEAAHLRALLGDELVWCLVAEAQGRVVGQITILPAARAARPVADPALAHLRNLFVDREHWGSGLAGTLHAAGLDAARERGFAELRLFAAARHGRARRFYEREGWVPEGGEFFDAAPGLPMVEYRYALRAGQP